MHEVWSSTTQRDCRLQGKTLTATLAVYLNALSGRGVHVVTARGMRNIRFYERVGFQERGHVLWNGRELVFLARPLNAES